jgi:hypothetical protein
MDRRARLRILVAPLATASLVACAGSSSPPHAAASSGASCPKVSSAVASALRGGGAGARVKVVVDLWRAPRAGDLLQVGVADCVSDPAVLKAGSGAGALPWGAYEMGPSDLPVMCFGWATEQRVAQWCDDPAVHGVDTW